MSTPPTSIYDILISETEEASFTGFFYENNFEKFCLILIGVSVLAFLVTIPFDKSKIFAYGAAFAFLILVLLFTLSNAISTLRSLQAPVTTYISGLDSTLKKESETISKLSGKDPSDLKAAYERLEFECEKLKARVSFMVGALDKVGIFPGIIALYFAYVKSTGAQDLSSAPDFVLALLIGLYVGAFIAKHIIHKLEKMIFILKISEERSTALKQLKPSNR